MDNFFNKTPEIIREASKSILGTISLTIIVVALLALTFFSTATENIRITVFIIIFIGASVFIANLLSYAKSKQVETQAEQLVTNEGTKQIEHPAYATAPKTIKKDGAIIVEDKKMHTISPKTENSKPTLTELRDLLSGFREFDSNKSLINFISLTELDFYANDIPLSEFGGKHERIEAFLSFLASKELANGKSSLEVFINSLLQNLSNQDLRKENLQQILSKLKNKRI